MLIIDPSDTGREKIPSVVEEAGHTAVLTAVCILGNHITIYLQNIRGIKFAYVYLIFELKWIFFLNDLMFSLDLCYNSWISPGL